MRFRKQPAESSDFQKKQELAKPGMFYGDGGTIHGTNGLDVEVHNGKVVAVWFRCMMLPFSQSNVSDHRATDMTGAYEDGPGGYVFGGMKANDIRVPKGGASITGIEINHG